MPSIKMIQAIWTEPVAYRPGEVYAVDERTATEFVTLGWAERADEPECAAVCPPSKAVRKAAAPEARR